MALQALTQQPSVSQLRAESYCSQDVVKAVLMMGSGALSAYWAAVSSPRPLLQQCISKVVPFGSSSMLWVRQVTT